MLRAEPQHWYSWDYTVYADGTPIADLDLALARETAEVSIGEEVCTFARERRLGGAFLLEIDGTPLVEARKPSALYRTFEVIYYERQYTLRAVSALKRTFVLQQADETLGTIYPDHVFSRKMTVDLPEEMPLALRVFIAWLVILMWKRQASYSG